MQTADWNIRYNDLFKQDKQIQITPISFLLYAIN